MIRIPIRSIAFSLLFCLLISVQLVQAQGLGLPTGKWGLGFGNLKTFTGIRFNSVDSNIDKLIGINTTFWFSKPFEDHTGKFTGLGLGIPMAMGTKDRYGVSLAFLGVAAPDHLGGINIAGVAVGGNYVTGINIGGIAAGAGETMSVINMGGLAAGAGTKLAGINVGGLAVGAGSDVAGINIGGMAAGAGNSIGGLNVGGLAVGAGKNVAGLSIGGLALGAGNNLTGLNVASLAAGAGNNITGINVAGLALGAGGTVKGLNVAGLAAGSGTSLSGITIAGLAAGSPEINGLVVSPVAGAARIKGIIIAPAYIRVKVDDSEEDQPAIMKGLAISSFNHIQGTQKGVTIGIFNFANDLRGLQLGVLNFNKSNPKGLRWLPIFNARLGKRG